MSMPEIFDASDQQDKKRSKSGQKSKQGKNSKKNVFEPLEPKKTKAKRTRLEKNKTGSSRPKNKVDEYSETLRKERPAKNPLQAFAPKPERVKFDSQMDQEEVVLLLRTHPITLIKPIVFALIGIILPLILFNSSFMGMVAGRFKIAAVVGWYMLIFSFILETFLVWFFSVYIVTDERIIDVDFTSLIYKNVSSAKIDKIEDITIATSGVLASLIDFGTVHIQTAAEVPQIEFEEIPHPNTVAKALNEIMLEEEREKLEGRVM